MKKFNLVIAALLVLSVSAVFAVDVEPSVTVTGEASVTFTYDLDTNFINIANDASATVDVTLVADTSVEGGEGDVVGHIMISDISLSFNSDNNWDTAIYDENGARIDVNDDGVIDTDDTVSIGTAQLSNPSVEAQIYLMGPALYIDITNLGAATDFVVAPDFNDDYQLDGHEGVNDVSSDAAPAGSVSVVYTADAFNVTATLGDSDADLGNEFDFFFGVGITAVENLSVDAGLTYDSTGTIGYGASASYSMDMFSLTVGYDGNDAGDMQIGVTAGIDVGATVDVTFGTDTTVNDLIVAVSSGSLVDMATLGVTFEMADFTDMGIIATATADVAPLSPYATFSYYDVATVTTMGLTVGTGIAVIDNVDLDLNYSTADLGNVNGAVEFSATISY